MRRYNRGGKEILGLALVHDHHSHPSLYASFEGLPSLSGLSKPEAVALLGGLPRDRLSVVVGWRTDRFGLGREDLLSLPPVLVINASLHGFAASGDAWRFLAEAWPELAEASGTPAWSERHLPELFGFYESLAGRDPAKLGAFMARMEAMGIGSLDDMTVSCDESFDLIASSPYAGRIRGWASLAAYRRLSPASRARCEGIKIFLDGSLGARSAALDAPFSDGESGSLLYGDGELEGILAEIASYGERLSAHAIGHLAVEQALGRLESLRGDGVELSSPRLEHVQFINLGQARRCKDLGIVLSMQPNFNYDSIDYSDRLSPRHRGENDPFRMLVDEAGFVPGEDLVFGSDGMPHGPAAALTQSLFPAFESQRLSAEELEAGYGPAIGAVVGEAIYEVSREERRVTVVEASRRT